MGFEFRLENLLRLQKSLQRKQLARLQSAVTSMQQARQAEQAIRSFIDDSVAERQKVLNDRGPGTELSLLHSCIVYSGIPLAAARKLSESAVNCWNEELAEYRRRKLEMEKLFSLRDAHYELYQARESKREQAEADELHSLRLQRQTSE